MPSPCARLVPLLLLAACGGPAEPPPPLAGKPVVVILFDALAAKHIGHLGSPHDTSPNLDALAAEGVTFTRAFAPTPYTLASIPSLFTGRLPDRHGVTQSEHVLPEVEVTLAETLAGQGYETFGAIANIQGGPLHDLEQGFEHYEELFRVQAGDESGHGMQIVEPEAFVPLLEGWIEERDPARPPFFYTHVLQPHMPYAPPHEHREGLVDEDYDGLFAEGMTREWMIEFADAGGSMVPGNGPNQIPVRDAQAIRALYVASIRHCDKVLGEMLDVLREAGMYDDALIVITSDHGEALWEHGVLGHSHHVYDEMMRVPLVVKFPSDMDVPAARNEALVSLMDLYPSICSWMDLATPQELDGRPFQGILGEPVDQDRELLLRSFHREPTLGLRGLHDKTIMDPRREAGRVYSFDLKADPDEKAPLGAEDADRLARMKALWDELQALEAGSTRDSEPTEAELLLIKQLGYAE